MLLSSLLLLIAICGGTLLTFFYDRQTNFATRLAIGASTGLALLATAGFLFSWWAGLGLTSIVLAATLLLLPWFLFLNPRYRQTILSAARGSLHPDRHALLFYAAMAVLLAVVFARAFFIENGAIYTGLVNNLGDLPLHLQIISSFAQGHNIHAEDPTYAGVRFTYPLLADFLSAMLVRCGASMAAALWMPGLTLGLALIGIIHSWTIALTRNRLAGFIAPLLVMFSGGLGWWMIFQDVRNSDHGLLPLLGHLPHDYTIMPGSIFRWGNALTALLVPQRSLLLGLPLAICIFHQWWLALGEDAQQSTEGSLPSERGGPVTGNIQSADAAPQLAPFSPPAASSRLHMAAAGFFAGLLPLIHAHSFIVIVGVGACLALIFRSQWRNWLVFFLFALLVAAPESLWLAHSSAIQSSKFVAWQIGWDRAGHNPLWFWLANTGAFIPLLFTIFSGRRLQPNVSRKLLLFLAPFLLCFIVPNTIKVAPWIWDNIKVLFYWYVGLVPVVALVLARWLQQNTRRRWIAAGLLASLVLAGALDILRVATRTTEYLEFDADAISIAKLVSQISVPDAVVLHAPVYNSPVFLTGRRSLLGYPGWIWSRGIDYSQRERDIHDMYLGHSNAETLLRHYHVDYVLIGPQERGALMLNETFWTHYPLMAHIGEYRLYKVEREK